MNRAEENSSPLGNYYPEDGGCKLRQHIDSSTQYHAPEDLNIVITTMGIPNLARCKQRSFFLTLPETS
jgi:hypothetical protein